MRAVPFVEDDYNSHVLIESLSRLLVGYPSEVANLYLAMLERCCPIDEEEHVKVILSELWRKGAPHKQSAKDIADKYIHHGVEFPAKHLADLEANARGAAHG
jgi:hypothetical protein